MSQSRSIRVTALREQLTEDLKAILKSRGITFAQLEETIGKDIQFSRSERGKKTYCSVDMLLEYAESLGLRFVLSIGGCSVDGIYPCESAPDLNLRIRKAMGRELSYLKLTLDWSSERISKKIGLRSGSNAMQGFSSFRCTTYRVPDSEFCKDWPDDFVSTETAIHYFYRLGAAVAIQLVPAGLPSSEALRLKDFEPVVLHQ